MSRVERASSQMEIAVLKRTVEQLSHNYSEAHSTLLVKSLLRILGGRRREGGREG